jgi:predicted metal-dependent hydrolase
MSLPCSELIDARVIRSKRRSICLEMTAQSQLVIRAPVGVSNDAIRVLVESRKEWIDRARARMKSRVRFERTYGDGESFLHLGKEYPLSLVDSAAVPLQFADGFFLDRCYRCIGSRLFTAWYRGQAQAFFHERLSFLSSRLGLIHAGWALSDARSRWGCCTSEGMILLSWRLIMAPPAVIDYVVIHELIHLKHRNHGRRFYHYMQQILPEYEVSQQWLKKYGYKLVV